MNIDINPSDPSKWIVTSTSADTCISSKLGSFSTIGPAPISTKGITRLTNEVVIDTAQVKKDPAGTEEYLRQRLAQKLAQHLIDEDLITIRSFEDISTGITTFRADIEILQPMSLERC